MPTGYDILHYKMGAKTELEFMAKIEPLLPELKRRALKLTRNPHDAEDLMQETMAAAWRAWPRYKEKGRLIGWLMTIQRNSYINKYRQAERRFDEVGFQAGPDGDKYTWEPADETWTAFEQIHAREVEGLHADVVDELPEYFRTTYLLREGAGLSYEEIAKQTGSPIGTTMSRLHRARGLVNERLAELL